MFKRSCSEYTCDQSTTPRTPASDFGLLRGLVQELQSTVLLAQRTLVNKGQGTRGVLAAELLLFYPNLADVVCVRAVIRGGTSG